MESNSIIPIRAPCGYVNESNGILDVMVEYTGYIFSEEKGAQLVKVSISSHRLKRLAKKVLTHAIRKGIPITSSKSSSKRGGKISEQDMINAESNCYWTLIDIESSLSITLPALYDLIQNTRKKFLNRYFNWHGKIVGDYVQEDYETTSHSVEPIRELPSLPTEVLAMVGEKLDDSIVTPAKMNIAMCWKMLKLKDEHKYVYTFPFLTFLFILIDLHNYRLSPAKAISLMGDALSKGVNVVSIFLSSNAQYSLFSHMDQIVIEFLLVELQSGGASTTEHLLWALMRCGRIDALKVLLEKGLIHKRMLTCGLVRSTVDGIYAESIPDGYVSFMEQYQLANNFGGLYSSIKKGSFEPTLNSSLLVDAAKKGLITTPISFSHNVLDRIMWNDCISPFGDNYGEKSLLRLSPEDRDTLEPYVMKNPVWRLFLYGEALPSLRQKFAGHIPLLMSFGFELHQELIPEYYSRAMCEDPHSVLTGFKQVLGNACVGILRNDVDEFYQYGQYIKYKRMTLIVMLACNDRFCTTFDRYDQPDMIAKAKLMYIAEHMTDDDYRTYSGEILFTIFFGQILCRDFAVRETILKRMKSLDPDIPDTKIKRALTAIAAGTWVFFS